jgi:pentatricopeptide repeat protein
VLLFEHMLQAGIKPDQFSYNALIAAAHRAGEPTEEAYTVFERMLRAGIQPNEMTYTNLIAACGALVIYTNTFL